MLKQYHDLCLCDHYILLTYSYGKILYALKNKKAGIHLVHCLNNTNVRGVTSLQN